MQPNPHDVIADLNRRLRQAVDILSDRIGSQRPTSDEAAFIGNARRTLAAAMEAGLVDAFGNVPACGGFVPIDDSSRSFSDPILPDAMVWAGIEAHERAQDDLLNYVSGETIDWDHGMVAVAIYRAMTRAALDQPHDCRADDREPVTITAPDAAEAARLHALAVHRESLGEWDEGVVKVQCEGTDSVFAAAVHTLRPIDGPIATVERRD